jgi:quinone-modifying oxidoreductase subunit QmoA
VQKDKTVTFVKSKVAKIALDGKNDILTLHGVDTEGYHRYENPHDLVVLAVGMEPSVSGINIPAEIIADSSGFLESAPSGGIFSAGCASGALDVNRSVQSATAAALRAIQVIYKNDIAEVK